MTKKRKTKNNATLIVVLIAIAALSGVLSWVLENFIIILVVFIVIVLFVVGIKAYKRRPEVKGKQEENRVSAALSNVAFRKNGFLVADVIVPSKDSSLTSQIDHIYIDQTGIYVIETKNYGGRIYGNDFDNQWTQVLAFGKTKNSFYSPVKQNYTHLMRLSEYLNLDSSKFHSMIVFSKRGDLRYINSTKIYDLKSMCQTIKRNKIQILTIEEVNRACQKLRLLVLNPIQTNKEHVRQIQEARHSMNNNVCPRCGGALLLRKDKSGNEFYGCSNYPRCRYTKK